LVRLDAVNVNKLGCDAINVNEFGSGSIAINVNGFAACRILACSSTDFAIGPGLGHVASPPSSNVD
jgi:hypothetical protein